MHTYLATQLSQGVPTQPQPTGTRRRMHAELAAVGERLSGFLHTLDTTPWYTMQHRIAEYQATLETQYGAAARADAARLATLQPPPDAMPQHDAVRQALAIVQYIVRIYQELQGQFDFATRPLANRLASQMKYRLYPVRQHLPALTRYWLLDDADLDACEPASPHVAPCSGIRHYDAEGARGAYTCYVPESYRADQPLAIIADAAWREWQRRDFLWTWLTYAKSRGYLLVSAKSFGPTWFPWDAPSLMFILDEIQDPLPRRPAAYSAHRLVGWRLVQL